MKQLGRHHISIASALAVLMAGCLALLMAAPAQAQFPEACDQYDDPTCIGPVDEAAPGGDEGPAGDRGAAGDGSGNGSGDGDGSLPFTGYPLTGLILLFLVLLTAGLGLRGAVAVRDRLARGPSAT